jgi:succinate-acetate transporter protein
LSTLALDGSSSAPREGREGSLARYADLALLVLALPVFLLADWPMVGYAVAAGVWLLQRGILFAVERRVAASLARGERRSAMGFTAASSLGRVWLLTLAVLVVGLIAGDEDGLAAALLLVLLFTVQMATSALTRLLNAEGSR